MNKIKSITAHTRLARLHEVFGLDEDKFKGKKSRLFPVNKKGSIANNETEATSIFLSVLSAVTEYRNELLSQIGAKRVTKNIQMHVYTELSSNGKETEDVRRPDALIVLTNGDDPIIVWTSFVEVKIDTKPLLPDQIKKYIEYGKTIGVKNLITISNQLASSPTSNPTNIKPRKTKKFDELIHWSWVHLSITAGRLIRDKLIQDSDREYVLSEFRRYLERNSKVKKYETMGTLWSGSTDTLSKSNKGQKLDKAIKTITEAYKKEEKNICLRLTDTTNYYIRLNRPQVRLNKPQKPRAQELEEMLKKDSIIHSEFYIDGNKSKKFTIDVDFIRKQITIYTEYKNNTGKSRAQITNLIKMLGKDVAEEDKIYIEAMYPNDRLHENIKSLAYLRNEGGNYSIATDTHKPFINFKISMTDELGSDFQNPKKIISSLQSLAGVFFDNVFIKLK